MLFFTIAARALELRVSARFAAESAAAAVPYTVVPVDGAAPLYAVDESALPGVYALKAADGARAYLLANEKVLVGVPADDAALRSAIRELCGGPPHLLVSPGRIADGGALDAWVYNFPETQRVVHRLDAGRGAYRRPSDRLLSVTDRTTLKFRPSDAGTETERPRDDGPWSLAPRLDARWSPGPSQGSVVVLYAAAGGARALLAGESCGYDRSRKALAAGAPAGAGGGGSQRLAAKSLRDVASAPLEWNFDWLLPSRGDAVHFQTPKDARDALEACADKADEQADKYGSE
ncbi:hypothetical protein M885DRAFT_505280 [Pelagophyceae sp. CCMP2097]|nr:hypothetical protein M885DRAFT_505280 [Pelagophyceae sp. CCMP2097]|mmetsp:Transcript_32489/g.109474  ORF Transcript_32489/g.109474 Transcript_32489/m.109474 type:complete len:290 (-) Transcript_32489:24-893(-)